MAKLLIVDNDRGTKKSLTELFENEKYIVTACESADDCKRLISKGKYDLIIFRANMPELDGYSFINLLNNRGISIPVIMFAMHPTAEFVTKCLHEGVEYFFDTPFPLKELLMEVRRITAGAPPKKERRESAAKESHKIPEITGTTPRMMDIKATIKIVAQKYSRALITGANGTGKELVACWLHEYSDRKGGPFVAVNCAAISSELIEATLFGHEKGSFTSADSQHIGKFEMANGGTLFLDEIGDMSLAAQSKVLRALQENKICRVGGNKDIDINVKVIAATNKNLYEEMLKGNFREDLFYRLNVINIHVPALCDRRDDIPLLIEQFNRLLSEKWNQEPKEITPEAIEMLKNKDWPGNIRQLQNEMERLIIYAQDGKITPALIEKYCCCQC